jgi:hypothetical protein
MILSGKRLTCLSPFLLEQGQATPECLHCLFVERLGRRAQVAFRLWGAADRRPNSRGRLGRITSVSAVLHALQS